MVLFIPFIPIQEILFSLLSGHDIYIGATVTRGGYDTQADIIAEMVCFNECDLGLLIMCADFLFNVCAHPDLVILYDN